jgi:hypothetical protein
MDTYFDAIYCINLDRDTERWREMDAELERVGLHNKVTRWSGTDAKAMSDNDIRNIGEHISVLCRKQHICDKRTAAVSDSHMRLWAHIKDAYHDGARVLILEDDARFIDNAYDIFRDTVPHSWNILLLGWETCLGFIDHGAHAYALTPEGATELLEVRMPQSYTFIDLMMIPHATRLPQSIIYQPKLPYMSSAHPFIRADLQRSDGIPYLPTRYLYLIVFAFVNLDVMILWSSFIALEFVFSLDPQQLLYEFVISWLVYLLKVRFAE